MFDNNINAIKTEPVPQRVFELCKIIAEKDMAEADVKEMIEPRQLNDSGTSYFAPIRDAAIELGLVTKEDKVLSYVGDASVLESLEAFRKYCNLQIFKNKQSAFYILIRCILDSNMDLISMGSFTGSKSRLYLQSKTKYPTINELALRGLRFWLAFLGFGYIQESQDIVYLPNMSIALKDFIEAAGFKDNVEYTIQDFLGGLPNGASVAYESALETHELNYAMSSALRQLNDEGFIELKNNLDSKVVWNLYRSEAHTFTSPITHILLRGLRNK